MTGVQTCALPISGLAVCITHLLDCRKAAFLLFRRLHCRHTAHLCRTQSFGKALGMRHEGLCLSQTDQIFRFMAPMRRLVPGWGSARLAGLKANSLWGSGTREQFSVFSENRELKSRDACNISRGANPGLPCPCPGGAFGMRIYPGLHRPRMLMRFVPPEHAPDCKP